MKIPVAHVEAGLRTRNRFEPFPEEMNRMLSDALAELHFAATVRNGQNLIDEGVEPGQIYVVGNTVVDALEHILKINRKRKEFPGLPELREKKIITVTAHRRESFGKPLENVCAALQTISEMDGSIEIVYPVHPNPNVAGPVRKLLRGNKKIHLLPPLDYLTFVELLARSSLILTDSGGIQEEAPTLRKPVLLLRNVTERPEGVDAGFVRLVGTATNDIIDAVQKAMNKKAALRSLPNPYGDGHSARRIASIIGEKRHQLISRQPAPVSQ
jgi:UDP-N-acetylglucosamine 2-epimerase (non-hydrolysing)